MKRVLRSSTKKFQNSYDLSSKLTIGKKSKIVKRRDVKTIEINNEDSQKSGIWNIDLIIHHIFSYINRKDLLRFNIVCKKWNIITNPIIHKTIKLDNRWDITWQRVYKRINNAAKIDADVVECIINNAKHAPLVKKFKFNYKLKPLRAIEVFETFRFISDLTIESCDMLQGQFLGMIGPLTQLQELTISNLKIKNIFRKNLSKDAIQLPSSLKKLRLKHISLDNSPNLFIQTINSHSNLVEFSSLMQSNYEFLEPFYTHYPSLLKFEFNNIDLQNSKPLLNVFDSNPQLIGLNLFLECWDRELANNMFSYLINLEELSLSERYKYSPDYSVIDFNLSQPTKIKKLCLEWNSLSNKSLSSILLNCPHLEELNLNPYIHYKQYNSISFVNISKFLNLKKISIGCDTLKEGAFDSLLSNCPYLYELSIILPLKWKEAIKSVSEKCSNLEKLNIHRSFGMPWQERDTFYEEFYETEFFTSNPRCKSTLTHLTLKQFKAHDSKAKYFENFRNLKSVKYPLQTYRGNSKFDNTFGINMDLWLGYKLVSSEYQYFNSVEYYNNIEFKRI